MFSPPPSLSSGSSSIINGHYDGCLAAIYPTPAKTDIPIELTGKWVALGTAEGSPVLELVTARQLAGDCGYDARHPHTESPLIVRGIIVTDSSRRKVNLAHMAISERGVLAIRPGFPSD